MPEAAALRAPRIPKDPTMDADTTPEADATGHARDAGALSRRVLLGATAASAAALSLGAAPLHAAEGAIQHLQTPHGQIAYRIDGKRNGQPPILLMQRFRGTIHDWDPLFIERLAKNRQTIRFDSAGVGRSGGDPAASIEGMAKVADAVLAGLGLAQADLLGWSLGGLVAQELALQNPGRVRRLVIAAAGPGAMPEAPASDPSVIAIASKPVNIDEDFLTLFFSDSDAGRSAGRAHLARLKAQKDTGPLVAMGAVQAQGMAMGTWPGTRSRLKQLAMPVLVANGVHDVLMPAYGTYVIAREAPDAKALLYPNAGHAFLFQYADDFAAEVNRFLSNA